MVEEARTVTNVGSLSNGVRPFLEELDILTQDLTRLFHRGGGGVADADANNNEPFGLDNSLLPSDLDLYVTLRVDHA